MYAGVPSAIPVAVSVAPPCVDSATAFGVNRSAYMVAAFGISTAFAGVAGALLAINIGRVGPGTFSLQLSLFLVVAAVVGLFGSIWGAALGAPLILFLPDIVGVFPRVTAQESGPATFFFGALLVVLMLAVPLLRRVKRA